MFVDKYYKNGKKKKIKERKKEE